MKVKYSDSELLDWLEGQVTGYGIGVVVRQSSQERGMRLHEIGGDWKNLTGNIPQPTIREAIVYAMESNND